MAGEIKRGCEVNEHYLSGPLPTDSAERKTYPLYRGLFCYFPRALAAVAHHSWQGNEQHHPGTSLHWDRSKSSDEEDALLRHVLEGEWEAVAWRALAKLEKVLEERAAQCLPPTILQSDTNLTTTCQISDGSGATPSRSATSSPANTTQPAHW